MDFFAFPGKTYRTEAPDEAVYEAAVFPVSNQKIWIVIQTGSLYNRRFCNLYHIHRCAAAGRQLPDILDYISFLFQCRTFRYRVSKGSSRPYNMILRYPETIQNPVCPHKYFSPARSFPPLPNLPVLILFLCAHTHISIYIAHTQTPPKIFCNYSKAFFQRLWKFLKRFCSSFIRGNCLTGQCIHWDWTGPDCIWLLFLSGCLGRFPWHLYFTILRPQVLFRPAKQKFIVIYSPVLLLYLFH